MDEHLLSLLQSRVAEAAVGPSALRNQGNRGVVERTRARLKEIDLSRFVVTSHGRFLRVLDHETELLRKRLPARTKHFGTARKGLNLYLRDILYHRYLCEHYRFQKLEPWLEVPLDRNVADGLTDSYLGPLPPWQGIKYLTPEDSAAYQQAIKKVARGLDIAPVHLDVYWWRRPGRD